MLEHISVPVERVMRRVLDLMEDAAEARRRGDHAAADAAETLALVTHRSMKPLVQAGGAGRA